MKILRLHCLRELVTPFVLALSLFTFIFMVGNLVKIADLLVNKGVGILDILKLIALLIPQMVVFVLPTGALSAVILVFGGFAQHNEITAMKASGIHVLRVMIPVMMIGLLLSLVALFFMDQVQPRFNFLYRKIANELILKKPEAYIESGRFIKDFKGYVMRVQKVEGKRLEGVTIFQPQEGGGPTRTIMAEWGEIISTPGEQTLGLKLYNGVSDEPSPSNPAVLYKLNFDTFFLPAMNLTDAPPKKMKKKYKDQSINELILILRNMKKYREELEIRDWMKQDEIEREVRDLKREVKAEIQRKISFAFATFSFVMVGLPLAIVTRRGEAVISFSLSLGVVAIYYVLSIWGKTLAVNGILPAVISLWLPNLIVVGVAAFLMAKVVRL